MDAPDRRFARCMWVAATLCTLCGCASLPPWMPFSTEIPDRLAGVPTPAEKQAALKKLAKDAGARNAEEKKQVVEDLAKAIRTEEDPLIRAEIVTTLGHYRTPSAALVLQSAAKDPDTEVRRAACHAWLRQGGPQMVPILERLLADDTDVDVRLTAARVLGQSRDPAAVTALGRALDDQNPAMQHQAVLALKNCTGKDFGSDVNLWRQFVKGETPKPDRPVSVAEQFRHMF